MLSDSPHPIRLVNKTMVLAAACLAPQRLAHPPFSPAAGHHTVVQSCTAAPCLSFHMTHQNTSPSHPTLHHLHHHLPTTVASSSVCAVWPFYFFCQRENDSRFLYKQAPRAAVGVGEGGTKAKLIGGADGLEARQLPPALPAVAPLPPACPSSFSSFLAVNRRSASQRPSRSHIRHIISGGSSQTE